MSILAQTVLIRPLIAGILTLAVASPAFAADPRRDEQWGLGMVKAPAAWQTSTGVGAVVAVIDTGVQPDHPDLGGRLLAGYDYVGVDTYPDDGSDPGKEDDDPSDGEGHGTHVTGIIVANRDNGVGIAGVAPGARVLPFRVLDDTGVGFVDDTVTAIERAIDAGAHVINLSLGGELPLQDALSDDPGYREALERAVSKGVVVVLAAGNSTLPQCESPVVEGVLCVGAVDPRGMRSVYSNFGTEVDLMAPGGSLGDGSSEAVLSTSIGSSYESIAGTSQSVPHVAGAVALLVSLGVHGQDAAARIIETAVPAGSSLEYGAGIVDAQAAVAGLAPPPPPPPGSDDAVRGSYSAKSPVTRRAVRRRGFRVTCTAVRPGPCAVVVRRYGRRIAAGRADVPAELATVVRAGLNRRGRRTLKRMGERIRVRAFVTLPGEATRSRRITVTR